MKKHYKKIGLLVIGLIFILSLLLNLRIILLQSVMAFKSQGYAAAVNDVANEAQRLGKIKLQGKSKDGKTFFLTLQVVNDNIDKVSSSKEK